jgi:hypothetical protein
VLEFKVLGPLRVVVDDEDVPIDDPVDRALLTGLLLNPNQTVSPVSVIARHLSAPVSDLPTRAVESAERLRRLIDTLPGTTRLVERQGEYVLDIDEQLIDYTKATVLTKTESTRLSDLLPDLRSTVSRMPSRGGVSDKAREAVLRAVEKLRYRPTPTDIVLVSIYLSDEDSHTAVEAAVEAVLNAAGVTVYERDDPIHGSWFRRARASELGIMTLHAADSRLVLAHDAQVTSTLLQNLGSVLSAIQPNKEAVLRLGAVLIVKLDERIVVHQLTAAQQLQLDHEPQLAMAPGEILTALQLVDSPGCALPPGYGPEGHTQ